MKRINIFLNDYERQKLNHIKKTHNLSYSAITDIIVKAYCVFEPIKQDIRDYSKNFCFLTKDRKKTSIKIHNYMLLTDREINLCLLYHIYGAYRLYKNEKLGQNAINKIVNEIQKNINKQCQTTIDKWANYNAFCRMKERYQRENNR